MSKQFGAKATKQELARFSESKHWDGKKFLNLEETTMNINIQDVPKLMYKQFFDKKNREPLAPLPIIPFAKESFLSPANEMKYIWFGHAVVLMRMAGKTLLIDPMFGPNAAPISPFPVKRFSQNTLAIIDELPQIDVVLLTHDHYDHLDLVSIKKLLPKVSEYYVALGVGRHLQKWGVKPEQISEFDWWQDQKLGDINITFTPTRHFSGRGLTDRAKSLWGGWAFKTNTENIWFCGDGGYGKHFKEIGNRLGPFDFAFMESGQYNQNWHLIHMFPEESIQAAKDAQVQSAMPFHWAGFALAQHSWTESVERFLAEANKKELPVCVPKLGELRLKSDMKTVNWWE
ncbi:MAG: MBL fold metallo-hydrolase [Salibacteraceae bacterium]